MDNLASKGSPLAHLEVRAYLGEHNTQNSNQNLLNSVFVSRMNDQCEEHSITDQPLKKFYGSNSKTLTQEPGMMQPFASLQSSDSAGDRLTLGGRNTYKEKKKIGGKRSSQNGTTSNFHPTAAGNFSSRPIQEQSSSNFITLQDEHEPGPLEKDGAKAKLLQKFEVINGLMGNSREASFIKNRYLKMLLSRSVLGGGTASIHEAFDSARSIDSKLKFNVNTSLYDSKNLQRPHRNFAANSSQNPVLFRKYPEQEIENINLKSRFMLFSDLQVKNSSSNVLPLLETSISHSKSKRARPAGKALRSLKSQKQGLIFDQTTRNFSMESVQNLHSINSHYSQESSVKSPDRTSGKYGSSALKIDTIDTHPNTVLAQKSGVRLHNICPKQKLVNNSLTKRQAKKNALLTAAAKGIESSLIEKEASRRKIKIKNNFKSKPSIMDSAHSGEQSQEKHSMLTDKFQMPPIMNTTLGQQQADLYFGIHEDFHYPQEPQSKITLPPSSIEAPSRQPHNFYSTNVSQNNGFNTMGLSGNSQNKVADPANREISQNQFNIESIKVKRQEPWDEQQPGMTIGEIESKIMQQQLQKKSQREKDYKLTDAVPTQMMNSQQQTDFSNYNSPLNRSRSNAKRQKKKSKGTKQKRNQMMIYGTNNSDITTTLRISQLKAGERSSTIRKDFQHSRKTSNISGELLQGNLQESSVDPSHISDRSGGRFQKKFEAVETLAESNTRDEKDRKSSVLFKHGDSNLGAVSSKRLLLDKVLGQQQEDQAKRPAPFKQLSLNDQETGIAGIISGGAEQGSSSLHHQSRRSVQRNYKGEVLEGAQVKVSKESNDNFSPQDPIRRSPTLIKKNETAPFSNDGMTVDMISGELGPQLADELPANEIMDARSGATKRVFGIESKHTIQDRKSTELKKGGSHHVDNQNIINKDSTIHLHPSHVPASVQPISIASTSQQQDNRMVNQPLNIKAIETFNRPKGGIERNSKLRMHQTIQQGTNSFSEVNRLINNATITYSREHSDGVNESRREVSDEKKKMVHLRKSTIRFGNRVVTMEDSASKSGSGPLQEPPKRVIKVMTRKSLENLQMQHSKIMSLSSRQFSDYFNPMKEDTQDFTAAKSPPPRFPSIQTSEEDQYHLPNLTQLNIESTKYLADNSGWHDESQPDLLNNTISMLNITKMSPGKGLVSTRKRKQKSQRMSDFQMPVPSSMKDIVIDRAYFEKLKQRLEDEMDDLHSNSKIVRMNNQIKHIANGTYGLGTNAWKPQARVDSASKKRVLQRMNRDIRMMNYKKIVRRQKRFTYASNGSPNQTHSSIAPPMAGISSTLSTIQAATNLKLPGRSPHLIDAVPPSLPPAQESTKIIHFNPQFSNSNQPRTVRISTNREPNIGQGLFTEPSTVQNQTSIVNLKTKIPVDFSRNKTTLQEESSDATNPGLSVQVATLSQHELHPEPKAPVVQPRSKFPVIPPKHMPPHSTTNQRGKNVSMPFKVKVSPSQTRIKQNGAHGKGKKQELEVTSFKPDPKQTTESNKREVMTKEYFHQPIVIKTNNNN